MKKRICSSIYSVVRCTVFPIRKKIINHNHSFLTLANGVFSYKMDLDFWDCFGGGKSCHIKYGVLGFSSISYKVKVPNVTKKKLCYRVS